jgi:TonB family protein
LKRVCSVLSFSLLILATTTRGQDAAALKDRLRAAEKATSLSAEDVRPYYLKIAFQLYDETGKPSEEGTVEEWWAAAGKDKRVYTLPSYTATVVRAGGTTFRTPGAGPPPALVELLLGQATDPMPSDTEVDKSQPQMSKVNFGKVPLECVMLAQPIKGLKSAPMGLFPTYCFDPGKDSLRATFNFGTQFVLRNAIGTFQQRSVSTDIAVRSGDLPSARGKITTLKTQAVTDADLATDGLEPLGMGAPHRVEPGVIQGRVAKQQQPIYPESAKQNHITGAVVLHALIGTDGHVYDLSVLSSPDPDLAIAAVAAVRQWVYKPYLLFGEPAEVETTITVNFAMNYR